MTNQTNVAAAREVERLVTGRPTSDGAGVALSRIIGQPALPDLDPFLLLDEFRSDRPQDYQAGFPDHPHRGFETVTYMIAGRMRHRDSKGNSGLLGPGSVQWMTAGSGIVHSEMPEQQDGLIWGFQLWVNLPAKAKMSAPRYQDIGTERIPTVANGGSRVRVIAGCFGGVEGPVQTAHTQPLYLDATLAADASFEAALPHEHNAFIYVLDGTVGVGTGTARSVGRGQLAVLTQGDRIAASAVADGGRFLLVAGRPLREPVARYGPIVMNTHAELEAAFAQLREGTFA